MSVASEMDQAVEEAKQSARPIARFYKTLIDEGMDKDCAKQTAILYTKYLLFKDLRG